MKPLRAIRNLLFRMFFGSMATWGYGDDQPVYPQHETLQPNRTGNY